MNATLRNNLLKQFESHRVVFWYDEKSEYTKQLDDLPSEISLLRATDYNDFALKYEILKKNTDKKLLVYFEREEPQDNDNWLLDVQLASTVFRTDTISLWMAELNLPYTLKETIKKHEKFFKSSRNRNKLASKVSQGISADEFEDILIAISLDEDTFNLHQIIDALVIDEWTDEPTMYRILKDYKLSGAFWKRIYSTYKYTSDEPTLKDFSLSVFESSLNRFLDTNAILSSDAIGLLKHWKDSSKFRETGTFKAMSEYAEEQLSAQKKFSSIELSTLIDFDDYRFVEELIIESLINAVKEKTMTAEVLNQNVEKRKSSYWFAEYQDIYQAIVIGKAFLDELQLLSFNVSSIDEYISRYYNEWYKIDKHYRQYMYLVKVKSEVANNLLASITSDIESKYVNSYLITLNEKWTPYASEMLKSNWKCKGSFIPSQGLFYANNIQNVVQKGKKAIVIVSDALRYEVGEDLVGEINSLQRFTASIKPMLAAVPSYTQLGMASLLPHKELTMEPDESIFIENHTSTQGVDNRDSILKKTNGSKAIAIGAIEVLKKNTVELRTLMAANNVVYIYHDMIDKNGEENLFKAAHDAIEELKKLIRLLGSANANNIWLTSDHGFIYQESDLETHMYLAEGTVKGKDVKNERRFAIGYNLEQNPALMITKLSDIGFSNTDNLEVAFPNSVLRMRLKGANTNFVHGGLSLQEVIIPLIKIEKARQDNIIDVEMRLLSNVNTITTGSIVLTFYQESPVSEKVQGYDATFGIYSADGKVLSDIEKKSITNESTDAKKREFRVTLHLNKASESYNRKEVFIKAFKIRQTGRPEEKISKAVMLSRSMLSDFDF